MSIIKKSIAIAVGLTLCGAALAVPLTFSAGNLKFTVNNYDSANVGYGNVNGLICNSVSSCSAAAALPAANGYGDSSWGIFSVQSITNLGNNQVIWQSGSGQYLTGMFGGLQDYLAVGSENIFSQFSTEVLDQGGWLNMYLNTSDYNAALGPGGRTSATTYTGITSGLNVLSAYFGQGVLLAPENGATYYSSYENGTIFGQGAGYLNVDGGAWQSQFETGSFLDPNGGVHDLSLTTTFNPDAFSTADGWTVSSVTQVEAQVPEPGSLAMIGLGLAAFAGLRRRKE